MNTTIIPIEAVHGFVFTNKYGTEKFYYWVGGAPEGEYQSFESLSQAFSMQWATLTEIILREDVISVLDIPLKNGV